MVWAASEPFGEYFGSQAAWVDTMMTSAWPPISWIQAATASAIGSKVRSATPCLVPSQRGMLGVVTPIMATFTPPRSTIV